MKIISILLISVSLYASKVTLVYDSVTNSCRVKNAASDSPTPAPTSQPSASPTPKQVACAQGELPKMTLPGFEDWFGKDHVSIGFNQVHTYCFTSKKDSKNLSFNLADRTGASQCMWARLEVFPPAPLTIQSSEGRNLSNGYFMVDPGIPQGTYQVRVTNLSFETCQTSYQIAIHY